MPEVLVINKNKIPKRISIIQEIFEIIVGWGFYGILILTRCFCRFYYKDSHKKIPRLEDPILIESVETLAEKIRKKEVSSEALVHACIKRIEQTNGTLNYFVQNRYSAALEEAKHVDELINSNSQTEAQLKKEKPLLGIPFTTKDAISVKGMQLTGGLASRKNFITEDDAECIKNLIDAGAIPIGLTNVPEVCMWWETYNKLFGRTKNAYDTTRIVGGSSGGEGCIQSVAGSVFGIGSDIGGSIRMPAHFNGVFGHKPGKHTVSNHGQFPETIDDLQESFLGTGPMCRKASDLKFILRILCKDKAEKKLKLDEKVNLKNIKVYYQKSCYNKINVGPVDTAIQDALENAIQHLNTQCKVKAQEVKFEKFADGLNIWLTCMNLYDFSNVVKENMHVIGIIFEMIKCICRKSDHMFTTLLNSLVYKTFPRPGSQKYNEAVRSRNEMEKEFVELLGNDGVFLYPTNASAAPYHNEALVRAFSVTYTAAISSLGVPATHIPMGLDSEGLPIGIQVASVHNNDRLCLAVAEELEKVFGGWKDPSLTKKNM